MVRSIYLPIHMHQQQQQHAHRLGYFFVVSRELRQRVPVFQLSTGVSTSVFKMAVGPSISQQIPVPVSLERNWTMKGGNWWVLCYGINIVDCRLSVHLQKPT